MEGDLRPQRKETDRVETQKRERASAAAGGEGGGMEEEKGERQKEREKRDISRQVYLEGDEKCERDIEV